MKIISQNELVIWENAGRNCRVLTSDKRATGAADQSRLIFRAGPVKTPSILFSWIAGCTRREVERRLGECGGGIVLRRPRYPEAFLLLTFLVISSFYDTTLASTTGNGIFNRQVAGWILAVLPLATRSRHKERSWERKGVQKHIVARAAVRVQPSFSEAPH